MKTIAALLAIISTVASRSVWAEDPATARMAAKGCIAIVTPTVQGISGSAADAASGLRDLIAKYLNGPSLSRLDGPSRSAGCRLSEVAISVDKSPIPSSTSPRDTKRAMK
jgi:hypothetical protein